MFAEVEARNKTVVFTSSQLLNMTGVVINLGPKEIVYVEVDQV